MSRDAYRVHIVLDRTTGGWQFIHGPVKCPVGPGENKFLVAERGFPRNFVDLVLELSSDYFN